MPFRRFLPSACVVLAIGFGLNAPARGDDPDQLGTKLGLTRDSKSLPIWSQPPDQSVQQLTAAIKSHAPGVMLVGTPKEGHGTAWVLSRKHRLLATNAHVADIFNDAGGTMLAISNGTSDVYRIDKVWYHPGVRREVNNGFAIRSSDPSTGEVDPACPDVAVLHVAPGGELPDEFAMATPEEIDDCFAQPVGMMGFPGHDTAEWPGLGEKAAGTFRQGVVCRLTDFRGSASVPANELQFMQHSMASWYGFSGSPIFLPNGHVVALNNSGRTESKGGMSVQLAYGVRIDCLWELLAHHNLDILVPIPVEKSKLALARYSKPDPDEEKYRKAQELVYEASVLTGESKYDIAGKKCNEALDLVPEYAAAYGQRAQIYQNYEVDLQDSLGSTQGEQQLYYAKLALSDAKKRLQLTPTDPWANLDLCIDVLTVNVAATGSTENDDVTEVLTKLLDQKQMGPEYLSQVYRFRGQSRGYENSALGDMNASVRLMPFDPEPYRHRARFWEDKDEDRCEADKRRSEELQTASTNVNRAWTLATSANAADRNGQEAVKLAAQACQITNYANSKYVGCLGASYAETGDFDQAVRWESKALEICPDSDKALVQSRLELYRAKKPFHVQ